MRRPRWRSRPPLPTANRPLPTVLSRQPPPSPVAPLRTEQRHQQEEHHRHVPEVARLPHHDPALGVLRVLREPRRVGERVVPPAGLPRDPAEEARAELGALAVGTVVIPHERHRGGGPPPGAPPPPAGTSPPPPRQTGPRTRRHP